MVLGDHLLNVFTVYAPRSGKPDEEKERYWNEVFHLVSCVPQNEMVVFAGDMNGHIGSSNVSYDGTRVGFGYGSRNADGSRILEFADGLNLVICNTLFTKQEAKLVTYVAGPVKSTVDYIRVREEVRAKFRNVKVISSEECVPKHKLLVMDMRLKEKVGIGSSSQECVYGSSRRKRHVRSTDAWLEIRTVEEATWKDLG